MRRMFIDGQFVESLSGETFAVENPATEENIDNVPRAGSSDAERAVRAAGVAGLRGKGDPRDGPARGDGQRCRREELGVAAVRAGPVEAVAHLQRDDVAELRRAAPVAVLDRVADARAVAELDRADGVLVRLRRGPWHAAPS